MPYIYYSVPFYFFDAMHVIKWRFCFFSTGYRRDPAYGLTTSLRILPFFRFTTVDPGGANCYDQNCEAHALEGLR